MHRLTHSHACCSRLCSTMLASWPALRNKTGVAGKPSTLATGKGYPCGPKAEVHGQALSHVPSLSSRPFGARITLVLPRLSWRPCTASFLAAVCASGSAQVGPLLTTPALSQGPVPEGRRVQPDGLGVHHPGLSLLLPCRQVVATHVGRPGLLVSAAGWFYFSLRGAVRLQQYQRAAGCSSGAVGRVAQAPHTPAGTSKPNSDVGLGLACVHMSLMAGRPIARCWPSPMVLFGGGVPAGCVVDCTHRSQERHGTRM